MSEDHQQVVISDRAKREAGTYRYGKWAGHPEGTAQDPKRCVEAIWSEERFARQMQCSKRRGHGPGGCYCGTHNPAAVEKRQRETAEREKAAWRQQMLKAYGSRFYTVLKQIADGHNDARALAAETIKLVDKE